MALKLQVIVCSTRPGRVGLPVAQWFQQYAKEHAGFDVQLVDLADFGLPLYDEPKHPRMQQYQHAHTKRWSESVAAADAYVFVTPEYNYMPPPSLVNALDYVYNEWNYKPCGFVSYGGVSGGLRAVQMARLHTTTLKMMPMVESVAIPSVSNHVKHGAAFESNELIDASAKTMLDEMLRWARALQPMREKA
ncbi:NADPH-dependent FMN reductase [Melaminivora suipulveris]|uniref:NADPH-dependent FMN reductase n=1 Tax=Melaminivora suipulveris TaxID=2109913 RepID=A0A2R3QAV8_9BURK|nr:NAD(P)H-dependent oxidoreductase [Melaminivora suipulveris]AVO48923.1 NADPH-dependent FMN reductase [Melaminivora suipulveris]